MLPNMYHVILMAQPASSDPRGEVHPGEGDAIGWAVPPPSTQGTPPPPQVSLVVPHRCSESRRQYVYICMYIVCNNVSQFT